jgi:dolichyl-phosphate-mannose-protein mannosyltransferase
LNQHQQIWSLSKIVLLFLFLILTATSFIYFPRWKQNITEATIGWDVSGYYFYLPAIFIYKDLKQLSFKDEIMKKYKPTPGFQQAYKDEQSGNYILKYSVGQAILYLPFFLVAHLIAGFTSFPRDGFSLPYQLMISIGSLLYALAGLWFLRKILLSYFTEKVTAITLLLLVLATNYWNYASIDGAMTHNYLFTLYCLLIWFSIRFYKQPNLKNSLIIGLITGLAILVRPSEIISIVIPVFWCVGYPLKNQLAQRFRFLKTHLHIILPAMLITACILGIQSIYWHYVSGRWIVYSYGEQGFDWLHPHVLAGLFSVQTGWWVYSPLFVFAVIGFYFLYRENKPLFVPVFLFSALFLYITFSWAEWQYGGSLGQRALVQGYPVFAFGLAAFIRAIWSIKWLFAAFTFLSVVFIYLNVWLIHQSHRGSLFVSGQMTQAYFMKVYGRYTVHPDVIKLLDTKAIFQGKRKQVETLVQENFEQDTSGILCKIPVIQGNKSLCLNAENQFSPAIAIDKNRVKGKQWVRASATFRCDSKEYDFWKMAQMVFSFRKGEKEIKHDIIRIYRLLDAESTKDIYFDTHIPNTDFDEIIFYFWNGNSHIPLLIDNLLIESFNE